MHNLAGYRRQLRNRDSGEAANRWDAGNRVASIERFERKIVRGKWKITYRGTDLRAHGSEAVVATDVRR
ncbi:hypothetical protein [Thermopirellula anaerolimosa]